LGRQTEDIVTALGTGIDGSVRRIDTSYEVRGMVEETTSYSSTSGGSTNIVDQVLGQYNDWGRLARAGFAVKKVCSGFAGQRRCTGWL
jgi:hypothetical protein